jgi:hypothetical protein
MVDGHFFETDTTVHSSNWNSTSYGFHNATHLVWLQELHSQQYKGLWLQEEWLWPLDIEYSCACSGSFASLKRLFIPLSF